MTFGVGLEARQIDDREVGHEDCELRRSGRISSVRMNSECQANSVKTRVLIWKLGSAPP